MKFRLLITVPLIILLVPIFTGCGLRTLDNRLDAVEDAIDNRLDAMEDAVENRIDVAEDVVEDAVENVFEPTHSSQILTQEDAEVIALQHAGFTADEVVGLHSEYDIDDRVAKYEVQFHQGYWEYEYDIHAETGVILSFDKDN